MYLPHSNGDSLEAVVKSMKDHQEWQDQQLEKQRHAIAQLREQLAAALVDIRELKQPQTVVDVLAERVVVAKVSQGPEEVCDDNEDEDQYEIQQSMWDAAILLFLDDVDCVDKVVLVVGYLLNILLQFLLLLVVACDMLKSPYNAETVSEMVGWRALNGHSDANFDEVAQEPLASKLCRRTLWSYEQMEYQEMYDYLYMPMPGYSLSFLAIVLWVLTCMVEYRRTIEFGSSIINLPTIKGSGGSWYIVRGAGEGLRIAGVRPCMRAVTVLLLCLPRFLVLASLCVVGSSFIALTPTLADIILNAVGLAFVMDVDEMLCEVLLPSRLRHMLQKFEPMPCGGTCCKFGGLKPRDFIRYLVTLGMVALALACFLVPFNNNVESAAMALCGGRQDFSYIGGTPSNPTVGLMNSSEYIPLCDDPQYGVYLSKFYGIGDYNRSTRNNSTAQVDFATRKKEAVFAYAFKGCGNGTILDPRGNCKPVPDALKAELPASVVPGANEDPPACGRFDPRLGKDACTSPTLPQSCIWDWLSYRCEDEQPPPGRSFEYACAGSLEESCETWDVFDMEHPTKNCRILDVCRPGDYDCFVMTGELVMDVQNSSAFWVDENATETSLQQGMAAVLGINEDILEVRLVPRSQQSLVNASGSRDVRERATFTIQGMPEDCKPEAVLASGAELLAEFNIRMATALGSNETLLAVAFDAEAYTHVEALRQQQKEAAKDAEQQSSISVGHGDGKATNSTEQAPPANAGPTGGTGPPPVPLPAPPGGGVVEEDEEVAGPPPRAGSTGGMASGSASGTASGSAGGTASGSNGSMASGSGAASGSA